MVKVVFLVSVLGLLSGCGIDLSSDSKDLPVPEVIPSDIDINGGGVKGPLVNADVTVFAIDTTASDLKGAVLGTGTTGADARIQALQIGANTAGLILIEVSANENTTDISSGMAPILSSLSTVINLDEISPSDFDFYATPLTTMAVELARVNADSDQPPFSGNADGSITEQELIAALDVAAAQIVSSVGFGLDEAVDIYTQPPLLTPESTTTEEQKTVLAYRQAIEAVSALLVLTVDDAEANNPDTALDADTALTALSQDLADGSIDGQQGGIAVDALADVSDVAVIVTTDVTLLLIPDTDIPVSDIEQLLVDELDTTGIEVDTEDLSSGALSLDLTAPQLSPDIDGDGVLDINDAFPTDASETVDTDSDGKGNNSDTDDDGDGVDDSADAFPLDSAESADTDGDGTGNNSDTDDDGDGVADTGDAFPLDASETIDTDGDGKGNNSDTDDDGDGVDDSEDAFPLDSTEAIDTDGDGTGNNSDTDDDGDGVADKDDAFSLDASETIDTDGDGKGNNSDTDDDGDGVEDSNDAFSLDSTESIDTDGDGTGNNADTDDDGDGVLDTEDKLPLDPSGSVANSAIIGSAGGTVTSPDGLLTLNFPANAVAEDTEIFIGTPSAEVTAELENEMLTIDGHYLMAPHGLTFSEPVAVTWNIPPTSADPNAIRFIVTVSDGIGDNPASDVIDDLAAGQVRTTIRHFSDIFILVGDGTIGINQPSAAVGSLLHWNYDFHIEDAAKDVFYNTEGAGFIDDSGVPAITIQPKIVTGDQVISELKHDEVIICDLSEEAVDTVGEALAGDSLDPNAPLEALIAQCNEDIGKISALCVDGSEEGLSATITFNIEGQIKNLHPVFALFPQLDAFLKVESKGTCFTSVEITEPKFISIGNDVDRITETPEIVLPACSQTPARYFVTSSNTQTHITNAAGSCSETLNHSASSNSTFGALVLAIADVARVFIYGESGVFISQLIDGVFGQLSDFTRTTTDMQHAVNDDGSEISNQGYSVDNGGDVKLRTLNSDGTNTNEVAFSAFDLIGRSFIGYAPITSTSGIGITSGTTSKAYYVYHGGDTATITEIGSVGDTALGVSCTRLTCSSQNACSVSNDETVGCAISAFGSEELYSVFSGDVVTNATTFPTMNFTQPIPGVVTASPFVQSNDNGQLVIATVNDNEVGKVTLMIRDAEGTEIQTSNFFLTDYDETIGFAAAATGSSIVLIKPSAEYPNGAIRIGIRDSASSNDGILTIPATEALLGTSPVPFFGEPFAAP